LVVYKTLRDRNELPFSIIILSNSQHKTYPRICVHTKSINTGEDSWIYTEVGWRWRENGGKHREYSVI